MKNRICLLLLAVTILFVGCITNDVKKNFEPDKIKFWLSYIEFNHDNKQAYPRDGKLVLYNSQTGWSEEVLDSEEEEHPKLFPNSNKVAFFLGNRHIKLLVAEVDIETKSRKILFQKNFGYENMGDTQDFEFLSDSIIVFGNKDTLFEASTITGEIKPIRVFGGLQVGWLSVSIPRKIVAFTYQEGFEGIKEQKLAFYDMNKDSLFLTNTIVFAQDLGDWSPDGSKLIWGLHNEIVIFNFDSKEVTKIEKKCTKELEINCAHFLTEDVLLVNCTKYNSEWNYDEYESHFYKYDLKSKKLLNVINDSKSKKNNISLRLFQQYK